MIRPGPSAEDTLDPAAVARHYDHLDRYYREIWGEHLHHGLWRTGEETTEEAVEALVHRVAEEGGIGPGTPVCDVGCGYGATARVLHEAYGAEVTGITLSPEQHRVASRRSPGGAHSDEQGADPSPPRFILGDWLENRLPGGSFQAVAAVESMTHLPHLGRAVEEVARVLEPGGRFVACVWLSADEPGPVARRFLLEPICREGRLAGLPEAREFEAALEAAGLVPVLREDLTRGVRRTWSVVTARAVRRLATDAGARRFLFDGSQPERVFAGTVLRLWTALHAGVMRYGLFVARKP